jgi:two-component system cell cycle sensor histidine kinase/response regulator CckA
MRSRMQKEALIGVVRSLDDIRPGSQLCEIYSAEQEHRKVIAPYLAAGLNQNQKVIYIADAHETQTILGYLTRIGLASEPFLASGQLLILTHRETYTREGRFDPDRLIGMLKAETKKAVADGYTALRVTAEMTLALKGFPGAERLIEYEVKLNDFLPGSKALVLCQYDRRRFEPAVLLSILKTSPISVIGAELFDNPYYVSPAERLDPDAAKVTLERWVNNLLASRRKSVALRASEVRYRRLFESAKDGILILDAKTGMIVDVNPFLSELLGIPRKEFLDKNVWELGPMKDIIANEGKFKELQAQKYARYDDMPLEAANGKRIAVEFVSNVYLVNDGEVIQCNIRDITARKMKVEELRESVERYRALAESAQDSIFIVGANMRMEYANEYFARSFGVSTQSIVGMTQAGLFPPQTSKAHEIQLKQVLKTGKTITIEEEAVIGGNAVWLQTKLVPLMDAAGAPRAVMGISRDISEHKKAEAVLKEKMEELRRLATVVSDSNDAVIMHDLEGRILAWNHGAQETYGYTEGEALGKNVRDIVAEADREAALGLIQKIKQGEIVRSFELRRVTKDGRVLDVWLTTTLLVDETGKPVAIATTERDITERKKAEAEKIVLERQFHQAQKMESVGRLAGGIAHDFNNLLTVINGYSGFVLKDLSKEDPRRADVNGILAAADRAAMLTRQLLAFSRKQILNPQVVDLNASVGSAVNLLKRLIGEDVKLETRLAKQPCMTKVDAGQIDQVLMNLAVNARDAMPKGGTLIVSTEVAIMPDDFFKKKPGLKGRTLVVLTVSDTGCGMTDEVKAQAFEPFFTTKEKGKGTGLGLSTVDGIIKQSGGEIETDSAPGQGTTFKIYFPQIENDNNIGNGIDKDKDNDVLIRGCETILLVEDEEGIRQLGERILSGNGYTVMTAASGAEGLKALERYGRPVDLVITDVVMPGMSGREMAREISRKNMSRRTLYISGYTDDAIVQHGVLEPGLSFLYKPFSAASLLRKMREVLDGPVHQAKA